MAGIDGAEDDVASHRQWQVRQRGEWHEVRFSKRCQISIDHRQLMMAVDGCAAVAGDVLDDGQHPAGQQPFGERTRLAGDQAQLAAERAVADRAACAGDGRRREPARS